MYHETVLPYVIKKQIIKQLIVTKFILNLNGLENFILKRKPPNLHEFSDSYDFLPIEFNSTT